MASKLSNRAAGQGEPLLAAVRGYTDTAKVQWVEIEYKGKTALVEYNAFASEGARIFSELSSKGLVIVPKVVRRSVIELVETLDDFPDRMIFSRPGWCGTQFANASGRVFTPRGEMKGAVAFVPRPMKCSKKGVHAKWLQEVALPLAGHPIPCFFIMAGFAAPLLEIAGRFENFGFELAGAGGKGKSTTQRLMASVVGPAMQKNQGYMTSFLMTPAALEKSMRSHSDMPFIIDEANLFGSGDGVRAGRAKMQDFSFAMASGLTKGRFDTPAQEGFRFIFMTSANTPFADVLSESHRDVANAANDRLMTITVPEGSAGVFGPLPEGFSSYGKFAESLEQAMARQYGTAMPKFLIKVVNRRSRNQDRLSAAIRRKIDRFKVEVGVDNNNGSDARVAEAFGLVYAAGSFARHEGILPAEFDCLGAAKHCYQNYRMTVPVKQSLSERLTGIANRTETMTIDTKTLPSLTDEQIEAAGAFIRVVKGEKLLLMTMSFRDAMLPDRKALRTTADFRRLVRVSEGGRGGGYRCRIRSNKLSDWLCAFRLPDNFGAA